MLPNYNYVYNFISAFNVAIFILFSFIYIKEYSIKKESVEDS